MPTPFPLSGSCRSPTDTAITGGVAFSAYERIGKKDIRNPPRSLARKRCWAGRRASVRPQRRREICRMSSLRFGLGSRAREGMVLTFRAFAVCTVSVPLELREQIYGEHSQSVAKPRVSTLLRVTARRVCFRLLSGTLRKRCNPTTSWHAASHKDQPQCGGPLSPAARACPRRLVCRRSTYSRGLANSSFQRLDLCCAYQVPCGHQCTYTQRCPQAGIAHATKFLAGRAVAPRAEPTVLEGLTS